MKKLAFLLCALLVISCAEEKQPVDLLVFNAHIYTVNEAFDTAEAFVVRDGKILDVGTSEAIQKKYTAVESFDAEGKTILPGLIDAHAHLFNLGKSMQEVDLRGTKSYQEVLDRVVAFQQEKEMPFILGRAWDQNDWEVKEFPTKKELDVLFPNTPVALTRVDGHAMIANSTALQLAGITAQTKMAGGEVILVDGETSGLLVDTPMGLVRAQQPKPTEDFIKTALLDAQRKCLELGLTSIDEAGSRRVIIEAMDGLHQTGELKLRIYAMLMNYEPDLAYFFANGKIKTDRLNVRSVKIWADGALGSRGAAMRKEYSDQPGQLGAMITTEEEIRILADRIVEAGFQLNSHAIGDSANISVLRVYKEALKDVKDPRWKVEHAQIVTPSDFDYFSEKILPSIQPTHATSDMYWAEDRVGPDRIKGAYAFKTLLEKSGMVALGTDFPVERVNPMHTFYAAVARKDLENYPEGGYRKEEGLTREETLRGMTIWAAYSNFEEGEKGSIEAGKFADFIVLDQDIMTCEEDAIPTIKVLGTYIDGEKVF